MKLVENWKTIAKRAHSMWAQYLGLFCLMLPEFIYMVWDRDTNPRLWWWLGVGLIIYGIIGRIKDQGISRSPAWVIFLALLMSIGSSPAPGQAAPVSEQAFSKVAVPLVLKWEGSHRCKDDRSMHCSYLDQIASPPVWTHCHGETKGSGPGLRFNDRQCADMLGVRLIEFRKGLHAYFTPETKQDRLTPHRDAAYVSLAYNAGQRAIGKSTATRRLNAGNIAGGCKALTWWNKAGGRVVRGLVNRRGEEYRLCMRGLG